MSHRKKKCRRLKRERQTETEQGGALPTTPAPSHFQTGATQYFLLSVPKSRGSKLKSTVHSKMVVYSLLPTPSTVSVKKKNVYNVETYFILTYKTTESVPVYLQTDCSHIGPIASIHSIRIV